MTNPYDRTDPTRRDAWDDGYGAAQAERDSLKDEMTHLRADAEYAQVKQVAAEAERDAAVQRADIAEMAYKFGSPDDPTGVKRGMEIIGLRKSLAAAEARAAKLTEALRGLLLSADCSWINNRGGHDWPEAVEEARAALTPEEEKP